MSPLGLLVLALSPARAMAFQQDDDDHTKEAPTAEGPLDNDVFVPVSDAAGQALARGDQALERARAAQGQEAERLLDGAYEEWRAALVSGGAGASVWYDLAATAQQRLAEGVHTALWQRLGALSPAERARWSLRFAGGAELALTAAAQHEAELREVVRLYPATAGAARAAIMLADQALEAGLFEAARGWLAESALEAELADAQQLARVLAARRAVLAAPDHSAFETNALAAKSELWSRARKVQPVGSFSLLQRERRGGAATQPHARAGSVFLGADELAVQTSDELVLLAHGTSQELALVGRITLSDLLGGYALEREGDVPREAPGWPLLPLAEEDGLVLVVGRTVQGEPNALVSLALAPRALPGIGLDLGQKQSPARLRWAIAGAERQTAEGTTRIAELEELGELEFQPGPVRCGDLIVAQAREYAGQVRAWLLAFDRRDGRLAWKRQLAAGADLVVTTRLAPSTKRLAAQPLCATDVDGAPRLFAGTHLGLGVLVDVTLGEPLWSFKSRRRNARDPGWSGDRPPLVLGPDASPSLLWGPADSDRLYALMLAAPAPGRTEEAAVMARPPAPLMDADTLVGGDPNETIVLVGTARASMVSTRRAGRDRIDALELQPDERFSGQGLASAARVWVATNRALYLFDRERELYLLASSALPPVGSEAPGGDVIARGAEVAVTGPSAVWWFRAF